MQDVARTAATCLTAGADEFFRYIGLLASALKVTDSALHDRF